MQALRLTVSKINDWVQETLPASLATAINPYRIEDAIWVKKWNV
jgi:hypothetical protein